MDKKLLFLVLAVASLLFSQDGAPDWENYTNGDDITAIESKGNDLWVGTLHGGLVHIDLITYEKVFYNRANSGLPSNKISELLIDKAGNIWIGTLNGLCKFDGDDWQLYDTSNTAIADNEIRDLALDSTGNIWVGTSKGLSKYSSNSKWYKYTSEISDIRTAFVRTIAVDKNNNLWGGFGEIYLYKFNGKEWKKIDHYNSKGSYISISDIAIDVDNNIWIGTYKSFIVKYDGEKWTDYNSKYLHAGIDIAITDMAFANSGDLWLGLSFFGFETYDLAVFDRNTETVKEYKKNEKLPYGEISAIEIDKFGNKWIGIRLQGLWKFNNSTWNQVNTSNPEVMSSACRKILVDNNNAKWIDLRNSGDILRYKDDKWSIHGSSNTIIKWGIGDFTCDSNGNLWAASSNNLLYIFNSNKWKKYDTTHYKHLKGNIYKMETDHDGTPWLVTNNQIAKYDGTDWNFYDFPDTTYYEDHHYLLKNFDIDHEGNAWIISSWGSLIKFDGTNWTEYDSTNSHFKDNYYSDIEVDKNGNIWLIFKDLYMFNDSVFKEYNIKDTSLIKKRYRSISIDKKGNKWIASWKGLIVFDDEEWFVYNLSNSGIAEQRIADIAFDQEENIWISHSSGVSYFKRNKTNIIEQTISELPHFDLLNYPNPFKQHTNISFELEQAGFVSISVFDSFGKEVASLVNKQMTAGKQITEFDAEGISPGVYYYTIRANGKTDSGKLVVVR